MADPIAVSTPISGTDATLSFETGKLAFQSQGSVLARLGNTEVLVTANGDRNIREGIDFFPLTVDVEERMYAAGRIPGSFFRREGRPTDLAILTCRLIDRPLRPSFADGYRNETQVVVTVVAVDGENPYDVLAINGASAALMLSGMPFEGPIGAVRIAWTSEGRWVPHPTYAQGEDSTFELVVAGRQLDDGDIAIMMVEAGGTETAWKLYEDGTPYVTEEVIAGGLEAAKTWIRESIEAQLQLVDAAKNADLIHAARVGAAGRLRRRRRRPRRGGRRRPPGRGVPHHGQGRPRARPGRRRQGDHRGAAARVPRAPVRDQQRGPGAAQEDRPPQHRHRGPPHRRPRPPRHPAAVGRGRRAPHRPRLGPVPAGRDPGDDRGHPGHAQDRPDPRQPGQP